VSLSAALAACGSSGSGSGGSASATTPVSQADIDKAMSSPTELTFWTWVPDIQQEIAPFTKKYPAVKVTVVNAGQGTPEYTKLRTAKAWPASTTSSTTAPTTTAPRRRHRRS